MRKLLLLAFIVIICFSNYNNCYSKNIKKSLRQKNDLIKQETISKIVQITIEHEMEDPYVLLAIAEIETGGKFNPEHLLKQKSHHKGIYQMSNNYTTIIIDKQRTNICKDNDRHCVEKSTIAVYHKLQHSKSIIENKNNN
jgi:hypothetical protein